MSIPRSCAQDDGTRLSEWRRTNEQWGFDMSQHHRRLRATGVVGGVAAVAVTLGTLSPAGAFVGTPGTGKAPSSYGPDLVSISTTANAAQAEYCFDVTVRSPVASDFVLRTYDAGRAFVATLAAVNANNQKCVDATFKSSNIELKAQGTTGYVASSGVVDAAGRANSASSAPLRGSTSRPRSGQTTGPDLIGATVNPSNPKEVTFTFDANVQGKALISASKLGAITDAGSTVAATGLDATTPTAGHKVNVLFAASQASAAGFYVGQGAVRSVEFDRVASGSKDAGCGLVKSDGKTADCTAVPAPYAVVRGTVAGVPHLTRASYAGGKVTLTWSSAVATPTASRVFAILDNGNAVAASSLDSKVSSTSARFTFGAPVTTDPSSVVGYAAWGGAVTYAANGKTAISAPPSRLNVAAAPFSPGRTSGPDLTRITVNAGAKQAVFSYDEPVLASSVTSGSSFRLLFPASSPVAGTGTPSVSGSTVTVTYAGGIGNAVGGSASAGTDRLGNPSNQGSVSTTLVPAASHTATSPASAAHSQCPSATHTVKVLKHKLRNAKKHHHAAKVHHLRKKLKKAKAHKRAVC